MKNTVPGMTYVLSALILLCLMAAGNALYAAWLWICEWWERRRGDRPDFTPEKIAEIEEREGKTTGAWGNYER